MRKEGCRSCHEKRIVGFSRWGYRYWAAMELGAIPKRKGWAEELAMEVEDVQMSDNDTTTSIESLPDEVLEHILSLLSPYSDLESCALTCSRFVTKLSPASSQ